MGITGFLGALHALRTSLIAPDVLKHDEDVTVELPYEAGIRFHAWLARNAPPHMPVYLMLKDEGTDEKPMRSVVIEGVKITWPMLLYAMPDGSVHRV